MINSSYSLRPLHLQDIPDLIKYELDFFINPWSETLLKNCLKNNRHRLDFGLFSNKNREKLIGYLLSTRIKQEGELEKIAIDSKYRGIGLGKRLIASWANHFIGEHRSLLFLEMRAQDKKLLKFYEQIGFKTIYIRSEYYQTNKMSLEDALILSCSAEIVVKKLEKQYPPLPFHP